MTVTVIGHVDFGRMWTSCDGGEIVQIRAGHVQNSKVKNEGWKIEG